MEVISLDDVNLLYECKKYTTIFRNMDTLAAHNYTYYERTYEMTEIYSGEEVEIVIDNKQPVAMDLIHDAYALPEQSTTDL